MSNDRPIIAVRFHRPVVLGNSEHDGWFKDNQAASALVGKISPRPGNPDLGEQRTSIVFEVRMGNRAGVTGDIDVEVPASNLAEVHRLPPEPKAVTGAKK